MRRFYLACLALVCLSSFSFAKDFKVHGFVTAVNSPTNFEIDDVKIKRENTLSLEIEEEEGEEALASFKPEDIRVGTELEIKGDYDEASGDLKAKSIKVFLDDTRTIKRTALIEEVPSLQKTDAGWSGALQADGQRVAVTPTTVVTYKPNKSERKQLKQTKDDDEKATTLASLNVLNLDTFIHYEGVRQSDGSILARKVEFQHAELEPGEAKMWKQLTPKVKEPNFSNFRPGELKMERMKYKLVPNKEAQDYVSNLGQSLIPARQKELAAGDPLKIPFSFYLIEDKSFNASAYPNGVVVVHSGLFDVLQNESQLAFVLSHEITHSIEKHTWRQHEYHKGALMALRIGGAVGAGFGGNSVSNLTTMIEAGIRNGYARSLENQADRVGLEWMLASGYDIREAPQAWKAVSKKYGDRRTNVFWDNHDNNTTRRSYLMAELKNNYSDVDYSKLKKDSDQFHHIADVVKDSEQGKKKMKVKVAKN
jgi:hypothetical protein